MNLVVATKRARENFRGHRGGAAAIVGTALIVSGCSAANPGGVPATSSAVPQSTSAVPPSATSTSSTPTVALGAPVHVSLLEGDGGVYGVGMPIVAYFDRTVSDATAFERATRVTVNGTPAVGAWYWTSSGQPGQALEAHYRLQQYWPANAKIVVDMPVKNLSAGPGLSYDDSPTLSITTGAANISTVDCKAETMTVISDGKPVRTLPTSCGKAGTPTFTGTKVVMQKGEDLPATNTLRPEGAVRMVSNNPADPYDLIVPWSVRLTNSGEYAHAASWNGGNIGARSTSNGCTNLNVNDAQWFLSNRRRRDLHQYGRHTHVSLGRVRGLERALDDMASRGCPGITTTPGTTYLARYRRGDHADPALGRQWRVASGTSVGIAEQRGLRGRAHHARVTDLTTPDANGPTRSAGATSPS